jgi:hypothetical protein
MNEQLEIQPKEIQREEVIVKEVKEKINFLYSLDMEVREKIYDRICDLADELEKKYPDARKYYLFHAMIGSGIDRHICSSGFDFPGDDSVVKLIDNLYREYKTY